MDARNGEFPWQAMLAYKSTNAPFCGGTLLLEKCAILVVNIFQVNEYNVPHSKFEGLAVLHTYELLRGMNMTDTDRELACVMGWCIVWVRLLYQMQTSNLSYRIESNRMLYFR